MSGERLLVADPLIELPGHSIGFKDQFASSSCMIKGGKDIGKIVMNNPWDVDTPFDTSGMWISAPTCVANINNKISGNPHMGATEYIASKYLTQSESSATNTLILGSNEGNMTAGIRSFGYDGNIVESDIAEKAMARAKSRYQNLGLSGIKQIPADLNTTAIEGEFEFIIAEGVLHHIENIDFCLDNISKALSPNGILLAIEYIGPVRFQLSDKNLEWVNAALNVMPKTLRPIPPDDKPEYPPSKNDSSKVYYVVGDEEVIRGIDPSEACIGEVLDSKLCRKFNVIERKGFGGTLLSYMTGHFDFSRAHTDPFAQRWLQALIEIEEAVISSGILNDHFCFYVLSRK
jgi:SAM-dependent methyltransferase